MRKIRIGYVSADFRVHSVAFAFQCMLTDYDRKTFEVILYSNTMVEDGMTAKLRRHATDWRNVVALTDDQLVEQIRHDKIDILVDLSGWTGGNRMVAFCKRPASIQVHGWGYLNGTGLPCMDYILLDPVLGQQDQYAEKVAALPCVFHYEPPDLCPDVNALPALKNGFVTFGYLGRWSKVSDETVTVWAEILRRVPTALLYVKDRRFRDPRQKMEARQRFGDVADRLRFAGATGHYYHLQAHQQIDIGLDPFPINGGVSTLEALWMGVPVVCRLGERAHGRVAASVMRTVGLRGWVSGTVEGYIATAEETALADIDHVATLRRSLRGMMRRSVIGDPKAYVAAVEDAYRMMAKERLNGSTPQEAAE